MKNKFLKIFLSIITIVIFIAIIFVGSNKVIEHNPKNIKLADLPDNYKSWLELSKEEKSKTVRPLAYEVSVNKNKKVKEYINQTSNSFDNLPDTYDLRMYNGVKPVKNQRNWGFCWAFAGTSSLESHMLSETRNSMIESCTDIGYDLNPMHVGYALSYNFKYDIKNLYGNRPLNYGGNNIDTIMYWTSGIGPVSTDKFTVTSESLPVELPANEILVQTENIKVDNVKMFPEIDIKKASNEEKNNYISLIKQTLVDNGALAFGSMAPVEGASGYNSDNKCVYTETINEVYSASHMMLIVGWDDNFSKDNFNPGVSTGQKPSIDGAWIVQNSWGTGSNLGVDGTGYYYYSYEDYGLNNEGEIMSVEKTSNKEYDNIYQYNPSGEIRPSTGKYAANVFSKDGNTVERLNEISFYNFYPNTTYSIYINPENDNSDVSKLECIKTYIDTNSFSEYVTVKLDEPIELTGEKFAVIIKAENNTEQYNLPILTNASESMTDEELGIKEGQSFVSYDGKNWVDTKDQFNASVLIKAFTSNTNEDIKVNTSLDKDKVSLYGSEQAILLTSKTQNISDTNLLEYEILDSNNNDVTNNFNISTSSNDSIHYANILVPNDYSYIGRYTINVKCDGVIKSTNSFEIERLLLSSINILRDDIYLEVNGSNNLIPKIEYEPKKILDINFVFESNNSSIAIVTHEGIITGVNVGDTKVIVSSTDGSNIIKEVNIHVVDLNNLLDGNGTESDPYVISSVADLNLIKANLTASYILRNDIDLSDITGKGFEPIGFLQSKYDDGYEMEDSLRIMDEQTLNNSDIFTGYFDGNNCTITGLNINRPEENGVALFSAVKNGKISNLKIRNSSITGKRFVSSFSAYASNAIFENLSSDSEINLFDVGGGIIAIATKNTLITRSFNIGNINQDVNSEYFIYAPGYIGGVSGVLRNSSINKAFNLGNINANYDKGSVDIGGIVGYINQGSINDIYNTGNVATKGSFCGGIAGEVWSSADIKNVYNTGVISANSRAVGDIVGDICVNSIIIENAYALESEIFPVGYNVEINDEQNSVINISKKTLDEMKNIETYVGFDFDNIWQIEENSFPTIRNEIPKQVEGIKIKTLPKKLEYLKNEENIDLTGINVVLYYTDGSEEIIEITNDMISGFDTSSLGKKTIIISYDKYVTTFEINIRKSRVYYLSVSSEDFYHNLSGMIYQFTEGEKFDFDKIKIYATYENDEKKEIDINDCVVSNEESLSVNDEKINISYTEDDVTVATDIKIKVYPKLNEYFEGNGTKKDPYLITTPEQFSKVRENRVSCYKLMNDIDMHDILSENGELYNNGICWKPIADELEIAFEGDFDGNNHKIIGLNSKIRYFNSVFGIVANANIENLIIEEADFNGDSASGYAEVVYNSNLYNLSLINSNIKSASSAAGIASEAYYNTKIKKCCVINGKISSDYNDSSSEFGPSVGGIASIISHGTIIEDCYNTSEISGCTYVGGICGVMYRDDYTYASKIKNTYNTGKITGVFNVGGIFGFAEKGVFENCYDIKDDVQVYGKINNEFPVDLTNVVEKELEELKQKSTFTNFDFENVWKIYENETPSFISKSVEGIRLKNPLSKLKYRIGENLDITGAKLIVTYSDNTFVEIDLTLDMISNFDNTKVGEQELIISYFGKETTTKIEIIEFKKGDINKDGKINVNDLNYGLRGLTKNTLTEEEKQLGDVNGDNRFTVTDLNKMLRYLVGKISSLD